MEINQVRKIMRKQIRRVMSFLYGMNTAKYRSTEIARIVRLVVTIEINEKKASTLHKANPALSRRTQ